jgi:phosphoribosyl-dephospho-CoA transferase
MGRDRGADPAGSTAARDGVILHAARGGGVAPEAPTDLPGDLPGVRRALLAARDARQDRCDSFLARAGGSGCVVAVSTVIPGADKRPAGADLLTRAAFAVFRRPEWVGAVPDRTRSEHEVLTTATPTLSSSVQDHSDDVLGAFLLFADATDARCMKEWCVALESTLPWGRLIDLDVYDAGGRLVTRHALGLPERTCLVCKEPARECMRLGRHSEAELRVRVEALLWSLQASEVGDHDERPRSLQASEVGDYDERPWSA